MTRAGYRIFETEQFQKDLDALARAGQRRVSIKLRQVVYPKLRSEPYFGPHIKKLKNHDPPTWRYRIGDWRFFYEIDDRKRILFMIGASHRSSAYS